MSENGEFNWGKRGFAYARQFCFPRLVGTAGEKKAVEVIRETLTRLGFQVQRENFSLYRTPWEYTRILMGVSLLLLGISRLLFSSFPLMSGLLVMVLLALVIGGGRGWLWFVSLGGKRDDCFL